MKKYLMMSMLAVVFTSTFTSCKTDLYDPDRPERDAHELYEANFKAYVGGNIHPNQKWGFDQVFKSRAMTRAKDATITKMSGYLLSFTPKYIELVRSYFPEDNNKKPTTLNTDVTSWEFKLSSQMCYVTMIYSNTTANDEVGLYYYDPATETPAQAKTFVLIDDVQKGLGPYYQKMIVNDIWEDPSPTDGYSVWDRGVQQIHSCPYQIVMEPTYYFGLYVKNGDKIYYTNANLNENLKPAAGLVGKDRTTKDDLQNSYVVGLSDDSIEGSELIFVVTKSNSTPEVIIPPSLDWYRIIAEDLNAHDLDKDGEVDDTDFDFNDIVIDIAIDQTGKAHCILQAAGATLQIKINNDENLEVHKLFGVEQGVMVNTNAEKRGMKGASKPPVEFTLDGPFQTAQDVKIHVYRQNKWMELTAPVARAASKIAVATDFVWPDERVSLKTVYPKFPEYVKDNIDITDWWKNQPKSR